MLDPLYVQNVKNFLDKVGGSDNANHLLKIRFNKIIDLLYDFSYETFKKESAIVIFNEITEFSTDYIDVAVNIGNKNYILKCSKTNNKYTLIENARPFVFKNELTLKRLNEYIEIVGSIQTTTENKPQVMVNTITNQLFVIGMQPGSLVEDIVNKIAYYEQKVNGSSRYVNIKKIIDNGLVNKELFPMLTDKNIDILLKLFTYYLTGA